MAPSPEYDKEPKAPDKSATHISSEDTKLLHNLVNDQLNNSDHKTTTTAANSEVENKHVETLDDEKLRALLDEAINYKCPKDREGKSSLFKELLEEVEQDEQACEAAARNITGCRGGSRRGARGRRALPHSNSLQDLVAALAAEPAPRHHARHTRHHAPAPSNVSARAIHGGSLPSGVDTSSLLSEEGSHSTAGYLATVRCVNPPPLAERRVSASDANAHDREGNRRSKGMFPMTYTARATLEIGSSSVCSGRAVTTTTASNQVRTSPRHAPGPAPAGREPASRDRAPPTPTNEHGGGTVQPGKNCRPRGPTYEPTPTTHDIDDQMAHRVDMWYRGLSAYARPAPETKHANQVADRATRSAPLTPSLESRGRTADQFDRDMLYTDYRIGSDGNLYRVDARSKSSDNYRGDISLRKHRGSIGKSLVTPTLSMINPRNVKSMTIGKPQPYYKQLDKRVAEKPADERSNDDSKADSKVLTYSGSVENVSKNEIFIEIESEIAMSSEDQTSKCFQMGGSAGRGREATPSLEPAGGSIELEEIVCHRANKDNPASSFTEYLAGQQNLFRVLEATDAAAPEDEYIVNRPQNDNNDRKYEKEQKTARDVSSDKDVEIETIDIDRDENSNSLALERPDKGGGGYILAELPNNAYVFLTLPKRLLNKHDRELQIETNNKSDKKRKKVPVGSSSSKRSDAINKNALRVLLFENLLKSDRETGHAVEEVDSAIPFSCITTPEVVASCNTTASSSTAVAVDPKPLQPVAGLPGPPADAPSQPIEQTTHASSAHDAPLLQPRSVIANSFNGLPLSRPNYGSTGTTNDEYKKSLDENGNSVQGYGSPLSGSSQHKKPRRKKSSKNETVIDCQQLDGYRGDKADVNELLRFIESNAETRGPKMRAKHKDDSDDKTKKRSSERRKDKEKVKRASSLEELSRTKLEDLTARAVLPPKPERRSWGEASPSAPASEPKTPQPATPPPEPDDPEPIDPIEIPIELPALPLPEPVVEQADFQTVTKKRKPRRRTDEPPRRARQPSPRRRESAPPSDRSNDSNDDMDSVHSLPQPATSIAPSHVSYADIARTRHNIPDLIESCNYYAEGEGNEVPVPVDVDGYPALVSGAEVSAPVPPRRREPKPPAPRRERKERPPAAPAPADCPAPDIVADRRPPVILLDSNSKPRDMDGVTFGFDINEQLLGGVVRRARCDLVRDAVEGQEGALCVRSTPRPLRYLPPPPPSDARPLTHIVHYVTAAWEDVFRTGKVEYFGE